MRDVEATKMYCCTHPLQYGEVGPPLGCSFYETHGAADNSKNEFQPKRAYVPVVVALTCSKNCEAVVHCAPLVG